MARLFSSGFELNSATQGVEWGNVAGAAFSVQATTVRSGSYAGRISGLASGTPSSFRYTCQTNKGSLWVRFYFRVATMPSAGNRIAMFASASTMVVALVLNNDGTLTLIDEDGTIGTSSTAMSTGVWYCIEYMFDRGPAGGSHICELRIDNVREVYSATRNLSTNLSQVTFGGNLASEAQTTGDWYWDNIAINDSAAGGNQTSWPGPGKIVHLHPTSQDDTIGPHSAPFGFSGDTSEYLCVDESGAPDDDTTYIVFSTGTGAQYYGLGDLPSVDANAQINVVHAGWRTRAGAASLSNVMTLLLRQNGSNTSTGSVTTSVASYRTNQFGSANDTTYPITRYTSAGSGNAFTVDDINNNLMLGLQRGASNSNNPRITDIWALVEYVPGGDIKEYDGSNFKTKQVKNSAGTRKPMKFYDGTAFRTVRSAA